MKKTIPSNYIGSPRKLRQYSKRFDRPRHGTATPRGGVRPRSEIRSSCRRESRGTSDGGKYAHEGEGRGKRNRHGNPSFFYRLLTIVNVMIYDATVRGCVDVVDVNCMSSDGVGCCCLIDEWRPNAVVTIDRFYEEVTGEAGEREVGEGAVEP